MITKALFVFVALTAACIGCGASASERPFAEYWVPMGNGETIFTYYAGKREIAPSRFKVRYRSVEDFHRRHHEWINFASVDCSRKTIDQDVINEADKQASMASIVNQNLWWLVCRSVPEKYRPDGN